MICNVFGMESEEWSLVAVCGFQLVLMAGMDAAWLGLRLGQRESRARVARPKILVYIYIYIFVFCFFLGGAEAPPGKVKIQEKQKSMIEIN